MSLRHHDPRSRQQKKKSIHPPRESKHPRHAEEREVRYTSGAYVEEPQRIEDDDFDDYIEAPALPNNYYEPLPHGYTNAPRPLARQRKRYTDGGAARQPREYYDPSTSVHTSQLPSPTKQRTTHARHASHAHYPADDLTLDHLDHLDTQEELVIQPYKSPTESRTRKRLVYPNPSFYPPTVSAPLESGFNAPPAAATITPAHPPQDDRREKYTADPSDLAYPPAAGGRKKTSQLAGKSAKQISIDRMDEWLAREEKAALKKSRPGTRPARKASVDEDPGYGEVRSGRGDRQFLVTGIENMVSDAYESEHRVDCEDWGKGGCEVMVWNCEGKRLFKRRFATGPEASLKVMLAYAKRTAGQIFGPPEGVA